MRRTIAFLALATALLAALPASAGVTLQKGDILVADAVAKAVILIEPDITDPQSGNARQTVIYQGLNNPRSLAVDGAGNILVADEGAGAVYVIDPMTGKQDPPKLVRTYSAALLQQPYGLALSTPGKAPAIYVTLGSNGRIASIDPSTGAAQTVCQSVYFQAPRDLAVTGDTALVADYGAAPGNQPPRNPQPGNVENRSRLVKVDLSACTQINFLCSQLQAATGVAVNGDGNYYLSDTAGKQIMLVNGTNGACTIVSKQPQYASPREIALQSDGRLVMADYVAGKVFVVDPQGGAILRTFSGGWIKGPNGVFVVGATATPPVFGSTFAVVNRTYVWKITALALQVNSSAYLLAALMNGLVYESAPQQPKAKDLVLTLPPSMAQILPHTSTGVEIRGTLDAADKLTISRVGPLGS
ncbi:MAG TPA: hypothetical protein VJ885_16785 [Thermoanaerobaculia bacterium]|nr:hypothetical protein [Thermoanaerobaculia bacterium]